MNEVNKTSPPKITFSHDQLWKALRSGVDFLEQLTIPGFVVGDTSRSVYDNKDLSGDKVTFGITEPEYKESTKSMAKTLRPDIEMTEDEMRYEVDGVPVIFKVIHRKYEFLKNLDKKFYQYDDYLVPNPFEKYFKSRYIVQ